MCHSSFFADMPNQQIPKSAFGRDPNQDLRLGRPPRPQSKNFNLQEKMKISNYHAPKNTAQKHKIPGGVCHVFPRCPTGRLSAALVEQDGRYPESGFRQNEYCTEAIFVLEGNLEITVGGEKFPLAVHDVFYIPLQTPYSLEGKGRAFVFIEPEWDSEQNTPSPAAKN